MNVLLQRKIKENSPAASLNAFLLHLAPIIKLKKMQFNLYAIHVQHKKQVINLKLCSFFCCLTSTKKKILKNFRKDFLVIIFTKEEKKYKYFDFARAHIQKAKKKIKSIEISIKAVIK